MSKKKLLIIHQGALGDFVLTFPALNCLKHAYHQVDAICQGKLGRIAQELNLVENWYPLESAAFASLYLDDFSLIAPKVRTMLQAYDQIVLFSYSQQLENILNTITKHKTFRIPPRPDPNEKVHVSEHIIQHLKSVKMIAQAYSLNQMGSHKTNAPDKMERGIHSSIVLMHPGSGSRRKNWPLSDFLKLAELLCLQGMQPQFVLGPAEYDLAEGIAESRLKNMPIHIVSELEQVLQLVKTASGFIGNDSGISHLAAFTGLPTVVVFGPSDPAIWKPIGRVVAVVSSELECSPCFEKGKNDCASMDCLRSISPDVIKYEFLKLLGRQY